MLGLQSSTNLLHILPSLCGETNAPSGGVCNFSNVEVAKDVDEIEEVFMFINEGVDRGRKQEEILGERTFPDIKSEPDEVSYVCMSVIGYILRVYGYHSFFFMMSLFLAN